MRLPRPAWRLAIAVPLTLGLAVGVTVAVLPSGQPALTVQLLAERAAAAALASPPVSAGQWVYVQSEDTGPFPLPAGVHDPVVQDGWMTADGTLNYGAGIIGDPIYPYNKLGSPTLPEYPRPLLDQLNAYSTGCADVAGDCNAVNVAANVLTGYGNYPSLNAVWFYALADVPGVSIQHITDAAGQHDIAFTFPSEDGVTAILVNASLLNAGTVQYDGYIQNGHQVLVLHQAPVSGPGARP